MARYKKTDQCVCSKTKLFRTI